MVSQILIRRILLSVLAGLTLSMVAELHAEARSAPRGAWVRRHPACSGDSQPGSLRSQDHIVERGKFRFFDTKQPQGEEGYEIIRDGNAVTLIAKLELQQEEKLSLTAKLVMRPDLTPTKFEINGKKPSGLKVDKSIEINGSSAAIREGKERREVKAPSRFFTADGYAPLAVEMLLMRYWLQRRTGATLHILPAGEVTIEHRGIDRVTAKDSAHRLDRYSLSGLTWGPQTLWMDARGRLVAVVGIGGDIESTLPVVHEGFEASLPFFLKRAAEDAVQQLTETARRLSPPRSGPLAITGATLIDGTDAAPVADCVVLVEAGRIVAVGPRARVKIPQRARVIDARGKYIVPGLWDMHAHLFKPEFGPAFLAAGVTTVRDVGNEFELITTMRDAARRDLGLFPWMLLAGYIEGKNDKGSFDVQVDTPDEARAAVRRYKSAGFEQIKIRDRVKLDTLKVIADEAHRVGMTLTGHVPAAINAIQAVEAGQDQVSHINFVAPLFDFRRNPSGSGFVVDLDGARTKRAIEIFKKHGTVIDPTLAYMEMYFRSAPVSTFEPGFARLPKEYAEHLSRGSASGGLGPNALQGFLSVVGALHRAGISIVAGTDVVVPAHSLHRELELLVKAGFTPLEAIQAATIAPARAMGVDKQAGTIAVGKRADLVLLDANPLELISNIRKARWVVVRGRMFEVPSLWRAAGFQDGVPGSVPRAVASGVFGSFHYPSPARYRSRY